jgi:hypothetical protein
MSTDYRELMKTTILSAHRRFMVAVVLLVVVLGIAIPLGMASPGRSHAHTHAAPVGKPLHGCEFDPSYSGLCPAVSLVKPPAIIKKGAAVTFRGRVADRSTKFFYYRISVSRGGINAPVEIGLTRRAHTAVVYPTRRWTAKVVGRYTVCVIGSHDASQQAVAHDCRTFTVR